MIKVVGENEKVLYEGSNVRKAINTLGVSTTHYYHVIKGRARLSVDSPATYFIKDNVVYKRAEPKKEGYLYQVGYKFNIKGNEVEITKKYYNEKNNRWVYEFNGVATVNAFFEYTDFNTLWLAASRALKL